MPGSDDAWRIKSISRSCAISYACRYHLANSRAPLHSLCVPVEVAEQWLVGIEPGCGLEPGEAVVLCDQLEVGQLSRRIRSVQRLAGMDEPRQHRELIRVAPMSNPTMVG